MILRTSRMLAAALLLTSLALLPACKKKPADGGTGGEPGPGPAPGGPSAVNSDYLLFAHVKVKNVLDSDLFADVKKAIAKAGATDAWDQVEQQAAKELGGVKPTDIDSVTLVITDFPERDMPRLVMILTANKPINKAGIPALGPNPRPDPRGFYRARGEAALIHFPDDKTLVALHSDVADKYLAGYAKDRGGWPMTADLKAAASGHTLYATVDLSKVPTAVRGAQEAKQFAPLLAARRVTITADLKGREIVAAARASFADAAAAENAKQTVQGLIGTATAMVDQFASGKGAPPELAGFEPVVKEVQRALKAIKVEVSGSDLTVAGNLKLDFDVGAMLASAATKIQGSAARLTAQNNLKQIGLALHNYNSAMTKVPIHGIGPKGAPLANATQKPLLSWRVAMLPYIEQENLYRQFKLDEPWDSENNKKLIEQMPKIFAPVGKPGKAGYTHLQMVVGPNAMQPPTATIPVSFPDGTSNTIAVIEAAEPVIWTKPDDVMLPDKELPKELKKKFGGQFPNGFNVLMWDGSVRFVRDTVSDLTLGRAINPRDGQPLGSDWINP